jgi:threonine-phosphate decarboxylase
MMQPQPLHGGQLRKVVDYFGIHDAEMLDFSANINPEGPPAAVATCLRVSLDNPSTLMNYPDLDETTLRQSLAQYAGVRSDNVSVTNGFVPLLDTVLRTLAVRKCLVPVPAFVEYRKTLERSQIEMLPHSVMSNSDFRYDVDDLLTRSHDTVLLANPQNPSGVLSSRSMLLKLAEEALSRDLYILLDEAFIDYCPEASLAREIDRFPNLIVFRSVTKFFGMAGLRVAYAIASTELSRRFQEAIAPWSVTTLASIAARVAVRDEAYVTRTLSLNNERRNQLRRDIEKLSIYIYPSAANFLLLRLPGSIDCQELWERLVREHHIVLRNCANYEALPDGHLRVTVRTNAENERLIQALEYEVKKA